MDPKAAPLDRNLVLTDIKNGSREDYDTVELLFQEIDSHGHSRSSSCSESSESSSTSHSLTSETVRSTFREAPETDSSGRFRSPSRSTSESRKNIKNAPFHNGVIPSGRPAIKDYSPDVRRRLSATVLIYENWVLWVLFRQKKTHSYQPGSQPLFSFIHSFIDWLIHCFYRGNIFPKKVRLHKLID